MVLEVNGPDGRHGYVEIEEAPGQWGPKGKIKREASQLPQSFAGRHVVSQATETILTVTTRGIRYHGKLLTNVALLEYVAKNVRVIEAPLSKMAYIRAINGAFICALPLE